MDSGIKLIIVHILKQSESIFHEFNFLSIVEFEHFKASFT